MRIAHVSDFHLRYHLDGTSASPKRRSREMVDTVPRALERIEAWAPDVLVVSGDLVDHPFDDMDSAAHLRAGGDDLAWWGETLGALTASLLVLPGNHDHPALFESQFPACGEIEIGGVRVVAFRDAEGEGHVPERTGDEVARFERVLADGDPRPQVHVQHYLVHPRRDEGYPHTYRTADGLRRAIADSGRVVMCLSGHYHPGHQPELVDGTWYSVAPAFCEAPHPWWQYELDVESGRLTWMSQDLTQDTGR